MTKVQQWIATNLYISPDIQNNIFRTIIVIIIMRILYSLLKKFLYGLIGDDKVYYKSRKTASYVITILALILVGRIWLEGVGSFMTFVGLFSAALAIVMKDIILNIAGWVFIIIRAPFKVGDRVEVSGISGDVIEIELFSFTIMEIRNWIYGDKYTGRTVRMPNVSIFNKSFSHFNEETPYIWNEFKISVPFRSNWKKAKNILEDIVDKNSKEIIPEAEASIKYAARMFQLLDSDYRPKVYTTIDYESANITFIIRFICHYKRKRGAAEKVYEDILSEFEKHEDVEFAYPITKICYNDEKDLKFENKNIEIS